MQRHRTFIALDPGKAVQDRLVALQESLQRLGIDAKWVERDNLHLTLLFLGEVNERDLLAVCRAVGRDAATFPAFTLTLEGTGCFPNARRPRVLWAGLGQGTPETIALHDLLENSLLELGCYRREARPFSPHLTLGRVRGEIDGSFWTEGLRKFEKWKGGEAAIREILVMSSELTPKGPIYTVMSRAKLA